MTSQQDLIQKASLPRALWSLSWPLVLAHEIQQVVLTILVFWMGHLIGERGLAVESLFRPIELMVFWFFLAPSIGASALVSRSVGAKDGRGFTILASMLTLNAVLLGGVIIVAIPFSPYIAEVIGGPHAESMFRYLVPWILLSLPGLALTEFVLGVIEATGSTKFGLVRSALDVCIMAGLVPLGMLGFGIAGAPIAVGIASMGLFAVLLLTVVRRRAELGLGDPPKRFFHRDGAAWRQVMAVGLPVVGVRVTTFAAQVLMLQGVGRESPTAAAGFGIAMLVMLYSSAVTMAVGQACSIIIGHCLGANLLDRAQRTVRTSVITGLSVTAIFVIAISAVSDPVILFLSNNAGVTDDATSAFSIMRWGLFAVCTWQIALAALTAHKKTGRAGLLSVIADAISLAVFFWWPGSRLIAACVAFCVAAGLKAAVFMTLLSVLRVEPRIADE
ncbi:MAG: family efflux transporter [Myxococcales bacterium]|nr:family efflux transporter [Myxococcales bacterium]